MAEQSELAEKRRLIFHLRGGPDGPHEVRSDQAAETYAAAQALWAMTMNGVIGRRFDWYEPDGIQRRYQVIDKNEAGDAIVITCDCVENDQAPA